MKNITYLTSIELPFYLTVNFCYENARVKTVADLSEFKSREVKEKKVSEFGYLIIAIDTELEDYSSSVDAAAHVRPKLLIVLSIISLFSDNAFAPFMSDFGANYPTAEKEPMDGSIVFTTAQEDMSEEVQQFIQYLLDQNDGKKRLMFSLLDRWRKACYLQTESEDNMLHDDEVLISYFHVLELLATEYYNSIKRKIKSQVGDFVKDIYGETLHLTEDYLASFVTGKSKFHEQLILDGMPVAGKILFALNQLGIKGNRLNYFLNNLIKDRNSVAHGRSVYQDKIIFPVPQFFPNAKLKDYTLDNIKYLTAHAICTFAGIDAFKDHWLEQESFLVPTPDEIRQFKISKKYLALSNEEFADPIDRGVNPGSIGWYLVDKKITIEEGLEMLSKFILDIKLVEDQVSQAVVACAILIDHAIPAVQSKCEEILICAYKKEWCPFMNFRNMLSFFEYNDVQADGLKQLIIEDKVR